MYPREESLVSLAEAHALLVTPDVCAACRGVAATALCTQCSIKLCHACRHAHRSIPLTKNHKVEKLV